MDEKRVKTPKTTAGNLMPFWALDLLASLMGSMVEEGGQGGGGGTGRI